MDLQALVSRRDRLPELEQHVNLGTRTYSTVAQVNQVSPRYRPEGGRFAVPQFLVPSERLHIFTDSPDPALRDHFLRDDSTVMPIHPEILGDDDPLLAVIRACPRIADVAVMPTASTRTVFVPGGEPAHFLKLHLPRQVSRFYRRIRFVTVEFSVAISRELRDFAADRFAYLPETLGIAVGERASGWGFILRERQPWPRLAEQRQAIPFFALYGQDSRAPGDRPLLAQLIDHHRADPADFTWNQLIRPLVATWCQAVSERGILLGAHAQNLLLELDCELRPTRLIHRDLDLQVDPLIRARRGLHSDFTKSRIGIELTAPRPALYSLKYDSFVGHHLLDYLAGLLRRVYGADPRDLQARTRELFRTSLPEADELFGTSVWYYEERVSPDNAIGLVDTGRKPVWR